MICTGGRHTCATLLLTNAPVCLSVLTARHYCDIRCITHTHTHPPLPPFNTTRCCGRGRPGQQQQARCPATPVSVYLTLYTSTSSRLRCAVFVSDRFPPLFVVFLLWIIFVFTGTETLVLSLGGSWVKDKSNWC